MPMTTASPERPSSLTDPSSTNQESAPKHSPYVEVPPGRPPIDRHGQMASQLQDSKYEPRTSQSPKSIITASCRVAEAGCHDPTTRNVPVSALTRRRTQVRALQRPSRVGHRVFNAELAFTTAAATLLHGISGV